MDLLDTNVLVHAVDNPFQPDKWPLTENSLPSMTHRAFSIKTFYDAITANLDSIIERI